MRDRFNHATDALTRTMGSPFTLTAAALIIVVWATTGPLFRFSDTWQLVINTGTTIVTFLMVFVIQNSQNRDSKALHLKLDEVIRALHDARNEFVTVEQSSEDEMKEREEEMAGVAEGAVTEVGHPEARRAAQHVGRTIARKTAPPRRRRRSKPAAAKKD